MRIDYVPLRPAYRAEQDGVSAFQSLQRFFRQGGVESVDRAAADRDIFKCEIMTKQHPDFLQNFHSLFGDFGADPVSFDHGDFFIHVIPSLEGNLKGRPC
ncbi:hypothetical protein SDC9_209733 [bioreactor metagenome]|uniref:Uncharacterized protein n=1 Tax=bioreactor metagenome TaxID=1076179 RepID=A0A645JF40_9ZZZZ